MKINSINVDNFLSFKDETNIPLTEELTLVVGPNNSGKTNIIRIIKTILEELKEPVGKVTRSYFYNAKRDAQIRICLSLSTREIDAILAFLYFQCIAVKHVHPLKDKNKLRNYFKEMALEFLWEATVEENKPIISKINITFCSLGLKFFVNENRSVDMFLNESRVFFNPVFLERLNRFDKSLDIEDLKKNDQEDIINNYVSDYDLNADLRLQPSLKESQVDATETLDDLNYFYGEEDKVFTIWKLIHQILKYGISFSLRRNIETRSELSCSAILESDGKNLANYLYSLKNASDGNLNKIYGIVQNKFREIFSDYLSFDVVSNKDEKENLFVSVLIDDKSHKRFTLDRVGDGVIETLLLITIFYGQGNRIIFLDEPTTNLHNTLLGTIMSTILNDRDVKTIEDSQVVIITHSEALLNILFFNKQFQIIYCNTSNDGTDLRMLNTSDTDLKDLKLHHIFKPDVLLGKVNLVVEGQADFNVIYGMSYFYSEDKDKKKLSLDKNDVVLSIAGSKNNFPKYKAIFDKLGMKYYFIADSDVTTNSIQNVKDIFKSPLYITESGIIGNGETVNPNLFVIKDGDLEDLMKKINKGAYDSVIWELGIYGRGENKPLVAKNWLKYVYNNSKDNLKVFEDMFLRITNREYY